MSLKNNVHRVWTPGHQVLTACPHSAGHFMDIIFYSFNNPRMYCHSVLRIKDTERSASCTLWQVTALRFDPRSLQSTVQAISLQLLKVKMNLPNLNTVFELYKTVLSRVPVGEEKNIHFSIEFGVAKFILVKNAKTGGVNPFRILCQCYIITMSFEHFFCKKKSISSGKRESRNQHPQHSGPERAVFPPWYRYSNIYLIRR